MRQLFMVFDVESISLHGEGFAVGYVVVDRKGREEAHGRFACPPDLAHGNKTNREWVEKNIPSLKMTHADPRMVRDAFWREWRFWRDVDAVLVADCAWPVEARFMNQCVDDLREEREWGGPFPLHDLASVILTRGGDPLKDHERKLSHTPVHDPLADARHSARLLIQYLGPEEDKGPA